MSLALVAAGTGIASSSRAFADDTSNLSSLKAQAQAAAAKIQSLGVQEGALSERFDAAQLAVQQANAKVDQAGQQLSAAEASANQARSALTREAVDAYTHGGANAGGGSTGSSLANADTSLLRAEYTDSLAANQHDAFDRFRLASIEAQTARSNLQAARAQAQAQVNLVGQARQQVAATQTQLQGVYQQDQGRIATLVVQIQQEQQAAAAAAAAAAQRAAALHAQQQAAAAAAAARNAAVTVSASAPAGGGSSFSAPSAPIPQGRGASGAVAAAISRVGDPYVWGASGPNAFDCSGLVMWAYAQAGIALPHYSGAQYSMGVHISMSQLQPGDLVFPSNPGEHVAMYVGGGNIVEAPYTGATVHVIPMSSFFVLAARIV